MDEDRIRRIPDPRSVPPAQAYEHLGQPERARRWYERFLTDWKDADSDIPEVLEARKHLTLLSSAEAPPG